MSNVVENGVALGGLGDDEFVWHTDRSSLRAPPAESLLYALEIPPAGGETAFCNMYLALDTLPRDLRRRIEGLQLKHDSTTDSAGKVGAITHSLSFATSITNFAESKYRVHAAANVRSTMENVRSTMEYVIVETESPGSG